MSDATTANIERKSVYADAVQLVGGKPLFSWVELSLTELCNRSGGSKKACVFCPRIDPSVYPNQRLEMSLDLAGKIGAELRSLDYLGVVVLCGYGEPTLHSNLTAIVSALSGLRVEIVTNGDFLTPKSIEALSLAGVSFFAVSLYDGPHQIDDMRGRFERAGVAGYILRDRWHCAELDFGLRLTNRAGAVTVGNQKPVAIDRPCNYLAYQIVVDWNGDVLLCPQDWSKRVRFGNVNSGSLLATWHSSAMHKRRQMLLSGRRCLAPCDGCNADGTLHGANHVQDWCGDDNDAVGLGSNGQDRRRAAV